MASKTKVSIIIPVYNEAQTVGELLDRVYKHKIPNVEKELIIIEDNSRDGSRDIVKSFAKKNTSVTLILQDKGLGKGTAVRRGLEVATGDIILIQDADLEYDVNDYEKLLRPIIEEKTDFVLGSRHLKHNGDTGWLIRRFKGRERLNAYFMNFGGILFHSLFNFVYGVHLTDPTTMYKVFRKSILSDVNLTGKYFELDWEIVCKFIRLGHFPIEIPVKYKSRGYAEGKKINFSRDVYRWLLVIFKVRFAATSQLLRQPNCRICKTGKPKFKYPFVDSFSIYECPMCGVDSLFPTPTMNAIQKLHDTNYLSAYDDESFKQLKIDELNGILTKIDFSKIKSSLEVGCASAYLTEYLLNKDIEGFGVELIEKLAQVAQKRLGKKQIFHGDFVTIDFKKSFDLIIMFDVFEHFKDPLEALGKAYRLLNKGGYILILTPDNDTIKRKIMRQFWTGYYLEHYNCFSQKTIRYMTKTLGFKITLLERFYKTVSLRYFTRKLSYKFPRLTFLNVFSNMLPENIQFHINDDTMLAILQK